MNEEQKTVAKRLGIVAAVLAIVILVVYFVYSPKEQLVAGPGKVYGVPKGSIAGVYRAGAWFVDSNGSGHYEADGDWTSPVGKPGDIPVTGTWDIADGPSVGTFNDGLFTLVIHKRLQTFNFGGPNDVPVVGDWNGDGRTKIGVFRKGFWLLDYNGNGKYDGPTVDKQIALGGTIGEVPIVGDWNGDGKSDPGVYRPDSSFAIDFNGNGVWDKDDKFFYMGAKGDTPVIGDWNGDGRSKVGIFHKGFWTLDYDGNQVWEGPTKDRFIALGGNPADIPVLGDWNGDGKTKVGVYRLTQWIVDFDGSGVFDKNDKVWNFGLAGDIPLALTPMRPKK